MNMPDKKYTDQALHFAWSFLALIPLLIMDDRAIGGMLSGLAIGLPRELVDQWPIGHWKDTAIDLVFFALGGAAIGTIL
jgi:hypothetical protein